MCNRLILFLSLLIPALVAQGADVQAIRAENASDNTRLVFEISSSLEHHLFTLDGPDRLVIDIEGATYKGGAPAVASEDLFVSGIRTGVREGKDLRVVLDLKQKIRYKSSLLPPGDHMGHRLVVEITAKDEKAAPKAVISDKAAPASKARPVIVAIDAGHGGDDTGAIGASGTYEKNVTLAIARRLKEMVDAEPGMKGVLVRNGDYFIELRKRMEIARQNKADFFVSIHADSFTDSRASGSSVYVLSSSGASSEAARWLAEKENASDLVGGISLDDKDEVLASVLLDLSQTATMQASHDAAQDVLKNLRKIGPLHASQVQNARFMVLKSPDIPSMLVETAFISNPNEEKNLLNSGHQKKLASAVLDGLKRYFRKSPPPGTQLAMDSNPSPRSYTCANGDTLSDIATRYRVSLNRLRQHNGLTNDTIRVGQVLEIPIDS